MAEENSPPKTQSISYPNQNELGKDMASIAGLLKAAEKLLPMLRREFRGEATVQHEDGSIDYIQISKPIFVRLDKETEEPIKVKVKYRDMPEKEIFVPNDEAIEEVLSMLKFMGLNNITRLTNIDEGTVLDDLKEFECKLAAVLGLKQKDWGIDKVMLPMTQTKIKTIVQDARYMCVNGSTLKAIQKTVQRVEQFFEGDRGDRGGRKASPYN